jgi:hypothetical protein
MESREKGMNSGMGAMVSAAASGTEGAGAAAGGLAQEAKALQMIILWKNGRIVFIRAIYCMTHHRFKLF